MCSSISLKWSISDDSVTIVVFITLSPGSNSNLILSIPALKQSIQLIITLWPWPMDDVNHHLSWGSFWCSHGPLRAHLIPWVWFLQLGFSAEDPRLHFDSLAFLSTPSPARHRHLCRKKSESGTDCIKFVLRLSTSIDGIQKQICVEILTRVPVHPKEQFGPCCSFAVPPQSVKQCK